MMTVSNWKKLNHQAEPLQNAKSSVLSNWPKTAEITQKCKKNNLKTLLLLQQSRSYAKPLCFADPQNKQGKKKKATPLKKPLRISGIMIRNRNLIRDKGRADKTLPPEIPSTGQFNRILYSPVHSGNREVRQGFVWTFWKHLIHIMEPYWKV